MLNMLSRTADRGWYSSLSLGKELRTPYHKLACFKISLRVSGLGESSVTQTVY
jgi:hypothetical protein